MIEYLKYVAWALWHGKRPTSYKIWQMEEEEYHRYLQEPEDMDPGWLCWCGHWQDDGLHCEHCGNEPPWGCDCGWYHDVLELGEDPYDEYDVKRDDYPVVDDAGGWPDPPEIW